MKRLDGINKVDASYGKGEARVSYDPSKAQPEQIQKAIEKIGYRAKLLPKEVKD
ncbi:MAG: heavy-metal-associated domain-containing protein [Acidobacteriota bacterium]